MFRIVSILVGFVILGACSSSQVDPVPWDSAAVRTTSGLVIPAKQGSVLTYRDIPYAQAPVSALRWKAPRPYAKPNAVIPAQAINDTRDTVACVQQAYDAGGVPGEGIVGTEDCLYMDIKAQVGSMGATKPVMVWIHGGGNTSGYKGFYNFDELVRREDVIVVTFNYRLGPLGWFAHPSIQAEGGELSGAANFGHLDIIEALKWVKTNIGGFGGDPDNVTIFGESAGGHNVFAMLASPLADGLFHKAISQSGYVKSATPKQAFNRENADPTMRRTSWQLLQQLDVDPLASADTLRGLNAHALYAAYYELDGEGDVPLTVADGVVIPEQGFMATLGDPRYAKNVPVIAGANRDEVTLWLGTHRYFVEASYPFTKLLPPRLKVKDAAVYQDWIRVRSAAWKVRGVDQPLTYLQDAGYTDLYAYRFDWDDQETSFFADFPAIIGAAHGIDIAFLTGAFTYGPVSPWVYPDSAERQEMMELMMGAWAEFARSAKPKAPIEWPEYTADERAFIHLDVKDALRTAKDNDTIDTLLARIENFGHMNQQERCLLGWETLTKVGQPDYARFAKWPHCQTFDAVAFQNDIKNALTEQYGSTSVL